MILQMVTTARRILPPIVSGHLLEKRRHFVFPRKRFCVLRLELQ